MAAISTIPELRGMSIAQWLKAQTRQAEREAFMREADISRVRHVTIKESGSVSIAVGKVTEAIKRQARKAQQEVTA